MVAVEMRRMILLNKDRFCFSFFGFLGKIRSRIDDWMDLIFIRNTYLISQHVINDTVS
jgi:hypothetical protein